MHLSTMISDASPTVLQQRPKVQKAALMSLTVALSEKYLGFEDEEDIFEPKHECKLEIERNGSSSVLSQ